MERLQIALFGAHSIETTWPRAASDVTLTTAGRRKAGVAAESECVLDGRSEDAIV